MQRSDAKPEADTDVVLVRDAKQGSMAAFEILVQCYTATVFRIASGITKCHEDAEEVVQDTFVKAFQGLGGFEERSRFSTWLTRIAVNTALMKIRGKKWLHISLGNDERSTPISPGEIVDWRPNPEQCYSRTELRELLAKTLDSLPESYRTIIVLRNIEGFSIAESAERLNVSTAAVKTRLLQARLQLRQRLNRYFRRDDRPTSRLSDGRANTVITNKEVEVL